MKDDFEAFRKEFSENQELGEDLGGGFRKIRIAIESKNKGKSGGARVIVYNFFLKTLPNDILLIDIYDKSELSTMQDTEYRKIAQIFIASQNQS